MEQQQSGLSVGLGTSLLLFITYIRRTLRTGTLPCLPRWACFDGHRWPGAVCALQGLEPCGLHALCGIDNMHWPGLHMQRAIPRSGRVPRSGRGPWSCCPSLRSASSRAHCSSHCQHRRPPLKLYISVQWHLGLLPLLPLSGAKAPMPLWLPARPTQPGTAVGIC